MSESIPKGVFLANWAASKEWILHYLRAKKKPYQTPRLANKFGLKHLSHKGDTLFYKGLEIITTQKRREEILAEQESAYGGSKAIYYRLRKKFIGITYRHVLSYLGESERRQLKQKKVAGGKKQRAFIHANRPGFLQADCTFYNGNKIVVFGVVDVFSRWCYYEIIKHKQPIDTAVAMDKAIKIFKKLAPHQSIFRVATDAGGEFRKDDRN